MTNPKGAGSASEPNKQISALQSELEHSRKVSQEWFERAYQAESRLERAEQDAKRLDWFEQSVAAGRCPALVFDDRGHWAVADEGMQMATVGECALDMSITVFVPAEDWRDSVRAAIDQALGSKE
jgi:hypothetical protein